MPDQANPIRQLPRPAEVQAHIGHLLIELALARRLFRLARQAESLNHDTETRPLTRPAPVADAAIRGMTA